MSGFDASEARRAANLLGRSPANRRLEVARQLGVSRPLENDTVWDLVEGRRDLDGVTYEQRTVPLGLVGIVAPDREAVADLLVSGNVVVARESDGCDGCDLGEVRMQLTRVGLPYESIWLVDELPATEIDALVTADRDVVLAERVGTHSHVYVDERAPMQHVTFLCMNALSSGVADTLVFHERFSSEGRQDVEMALTATATQAEVLSVPSLRHAIELVDRRSAGTVETVLTEDLPTVWDYTTAVDSSALVVNCSPKFASTLQGGGARVGLLRTRWIVTGDGQTTPLEAGEPMPATDVTDGPTDSRE